MESMCCRPGIQSRRDQTLDSAAHIDLEDTIAFGDYLNDLEMLSYVGHGVAMGNAPEIVKKAARHITRDVDQDGIQYGLRLLGLLGKEPQEIV